MPEFIDTEDEEEYVRPNGWRIIVVLDQDGLQYMAETHISGDVDTLRDRDLFHIAVDKSVKQAVEGMAHGHD